MIATIIMQIKLGFKWIRNKIVAWTIWLFTSFTPWAFLISCFIVLFFFFLLPYHIFSDPQFYTTEHFKDYVEIVRNVLMGLVPLFGFPLIVWGTETAYEQKETAKKSLQETENNNRRTQENKIFVDCINHLASDKETIRTASIHGFGELLGNLENEIKNLSETDTRKQERINFQDKILNILWSFMIEHSREVLKLKAKDETSQEYKDAKEKINSLYHPQFRFIMELLAKYRPYKRQEENKFWQNKSWKSIYLHGIDLSSAKLSGANFILADLIDAYLCGANLSGANLNGANLMTKNLSGADLREADLIDAYLCGANLSGANLKRANLMKANLRGADLRGADLIDADLVVAKLCDANLSGAKLMNAKLSGTDLSGADLNYTQYNNKTIFPVDFDKTKHGMTNLDEPTEQVKQAEKTPENAE